jgi:hypothetical protein
MNGVTNHPAYYELSQMHFPYNSCLSYDDWGIWLADAIAEGDRAKLDDIFSGDGYDWEERRSGVLDARIDSLLSDQL